MQIVKFGGTSVGAPERMWHVADLVDDGQPKIVVLSAVAGTTNKLVELGRLVSEENWREAGELLASLREEYEVFNYELFDTQFDRQAGRRILDRHFQQLTDFLGTKPLNGETGRIILAQGELISTHLFHHYLQTRGSSAVIIPALDFMKTDENGDPDLPFIRQELERRLAEHAGAQLYITQGYICRNARGEVDNLKRGGSDFTATIIGAALRAEAIQIWTDIDGVHNNDPRVVEHTFPVRRLSYREAAELAYFGAKILHPTCVLPAEREGIPIYLKNTFQPDAAGTLISARASGEALAAIAAKDGITAIKIRSHRMLLAYGFLRRVFEVFEKYQTPIDMITTSEVAVSLTIDDNTHLEAILAELRSFGEVSVDTEQTIICIVGDALSDRKGYGKVIFSALSEVPIRMVSYGGSNNNVSVLVNSSHKTDALRALNRQLFPALAKAYKG